MTTPRDRWLPIIYAAATFVSAFLLFQIQPLISKRILPWFGGSPAVWTTCLVFFQTVLFAGYAYAHWASGWLKPRQQAIVHAALIIVALIFARLFPAVAGSRPARNNRFHRFFLSLQRVSAFPTSCSRPQDRCSKLGSHNPFQDVCLIGCMHSPILVRFSRLPVTHSSSSPSSPSNVKRSFGPVGLSSTPVFVHTSRGRST